ncbi:MAG: hypothetical protein U0228_12595 [Myxococcaceae bacterium]
MESVEPVHPELDALIVSGQDTPETWKVYADWLEERGDPRAALMRSRSPAEHDRLVTQHWARWFGPLDRGSVHELSWRHGFLETLSLHPRAAPSFVIAGLRFLADVRVAFPFGSALDGLDALPRLSRLSLRIPWSERWPEALRGASHRVTSLAVELEGFGGNGDLWLLGRKLPALRHFVLDASALPQQTLGQLTHAPWLGHLESLTLVGVTKDSAPVLLNRSQPFARLGDRLVLGLDADAVSLHGQRLATTLPLARVGPSTRRNTVGIG